MNDIDIEPGSPSERIAKHLAEHPGVELTRTEVARLLQVAPAAVDPALAAGVTLGLITCFSKGDLGRCWRAGPRLALWRQDSAAKRQPALQAVPAPKRPRGGHGKRLPPLQLSLLTASNDLPLPHATGLCAKGRTKYDHLLDELTQDGKSLTGIPMDYKSALKKAIDTYLKQRPALAAKSTLVVRAVDDTTLGVWRAPKGTPGTQAMGGRGSRQAA